MNTHNNIHTGTELLFYAALYKNPVGMGWEWLSFFFFNVNQDTEVCG